MDNENISSLSKSQRIKEIFGLSLNKKTNSKANTITYEDSVFLNDSKQSQKIGQLSNMINDVLNTNNKAQTINLNVNIKSNTYNMYLGNEKPRNTFKKKDIEDRGNIIFFVPCINCNNLIHLNDVGNN